MNTIFAIINIFLSLNVITSAPITPNSNNTAITTVANPLGSGADPSVVYAQDNYHLFLADGKGGVTLTRSKDLNTILSAPSSKTTIYQAADLSINEATDGTYLEAVGKWVVYVNELTKTSPRCILSETSDPTGAYTDFGIMTALPNTYDAHLLSNGPAGKSYLFLSTFSKLQIVEVDPKNPCILIGTVKDLFALDPALTWEKNVIEAPATVIKGDTLNLVFSTGEWAKPEYMSGLATAKMSSDITDVKSWNVQPAPVFSQSGNVQGPGSGCFFNDPSGATLFAYGALSAPFTYVNGQGRSVRAQPVSFNTDGVVQMGIPAQA